jgi:hypothetical protein
MGNNGLDQFSNNVSPNCNLKPMKSIYIYIWLTAFTFLSRSAEAQYLKSAVRKCIMFFLAVLGNKIVDRVLCTIICTIIFRPNIISQLDSSVDYDIETHYEFSFIFVVYRM